MTTKGAILKAIRDACLDCCCGSVQEVSLCPVGKKCALFEFRFGKDPNPCKTKGFSKTTRTHDEFSMNTSEPIEKYPVSSNCQVESLQVESSKPVKTGEFNDKKHL